MMTIPNKGDISKEWFNQGFANLLIYTRDHIGIDVREDYVTDNGYKLGDWVKTVRKKRREGKLSHKQQYLLENIGLSQNGQMQNWESVYCYARNYYLDNGVLPEDIGYHTEEGVILGAWIDKQKRFGYLLTEEQQEKLRTIGIVVVKENGENITV